MRKTLFKILSFCLAVALLTSCSAFTVKDVSSVATVNGEEILTEEFEYYLLIAKQNILTSAGAAEDSKEFWETTDIGGKNAADLAKETALDDAITTTLIAQKARELGISADTSEAKKQISSVLASADDIISTYGITESGLRSSLEKYYLSANLMQQLAEDGKLDISEEALRKTYEENFRTIKHILFSMTDPQTNETLYTLEETEKMALYAKDQITKNGADFDELMNSSSMDPGLQTNPGGYTFTNDGSMVPQFETAAFELEIGEISDVVLTSYGSHILKREPLLSYDEYVSLNGNSSISMILERAYEQELSAEYKASSKIERNDKVYNSLKLY